MLCGRIQQTFVIKSQLVNILGFASHMASVTTTQVCCCREKVVVDDSKQASMTSINKTLFTKALQWI